MRMTFINNIKCGFLIIISIVVYILTVLDNFFFGYSIAGRDFITITAIIIAIPSTILHINYFSHDFRKKILFDLDSKELIIENKGQVIRILFSEITKIVQHKSWFGENWNYTFFMGNEYKYYKIFTRNKGKFIVTCLIISNETKIPLLVNRETDIYPIIYHNP